MGFYIRKSFKAGPFRLNLSKSGLGLSAGVKGARLGVDAKGRAYGHAGRYGLYHRQYLSEKESSSGARRARSVSRHVDEEIHIATDATYPVKEPASAANISPSGTIAEPHRPTSKAFVGAVVLMIVGALGYALSAPWWLTSAFALGSFSLLALAIRNLRISWVRKSLQIAVTELLEAEPNTTNFQSVAARVRESQLPIDDIEFVGKSTFAKLALDIVADGRVEEDEKLKLEWCERVFELSRDFAVACKVAAFQSVFLEAVADRDLTTDEETMLSHVRTELGIPDDAISEMQETIEELAEVRRVQEGQLEKIETAQKLGHGEKCYYEAPGRLLKYKILRAFTQDGVRHKMKGFEVAKEGTLLITTKRVTLRHQGTSSIPYEKILNVEIDADQNLLTITKDGVQKPVFITTPNALRAGAIIAYLASL